jgi:hypothetical protein
LLDEESVIALLLAVVPVVVLVARTRFWWLPGIAVAVCAIPVVGFILGGTRDGIGDELFSVGSALLWGGLVAGLGFALCALGGVINHLFERRGVLMSQRGGATTSQLF